MPIGTLVACALPICAMPLASRLVDVTHRQTSETAAGIWGYGKGRPRRQRLAGVANPCSDVR
jgi:hypothetical protein